MHFHENWHMGAMWIWWLLVIAVALLLGWAAFTITRRNQTAPESPEQILKRRFARGEIDKEQYERMRDELRE